MSAKVAASAEKNQLCIWLINDLSGELQDAITELFVNYEVVARNTKLHSTAQRRDQLLQDVQPSSPQ
eukprot:5763002-Prorocentrum_lima.AAC.1